MNEHGSFDLDEFVRQRLEKNPRTLKAGRGFWNQRNAQSSGGEVDALDDRPCLLQVIWVDTYAEEVVRDLLVERGVNRAGHPVDRLFYEIVNREAQLLFEWVICGYADAEVFLGDSFNPQVSVENGHHAKSDMHLASKYTRLQMNGGVGLQRDARETRTWWLLALKEGQDLLVNVERVSNPKRPAILHGRIDRVIEAALDVFDGLSNFTNG